MIERACIDSYDRSINLRSFTVLLQTEDEEEINKEEEVFKILPVNSICLIGISRMASKLISVYVLYPLPRSLSWDPEAAKYLLVLIKENYLASEQKRCPASDG